MFCSWLRAERGYFIYPDLRASTASGAPSAVLFTPATTEVAATNRCVAHSCGLSQGILA